MTDDATSPQEQPREPQWQPVSAIDRRVAGVLVEKAKTTPAAYPLSLNAVTTACNQKSNRSPVMSLEPDEVEESLERLRLLGAVGILQGYGRVAKYRHYLYDWLAVDKVEIAVVAELLLRGAQTEGELRSRASRMEPIADLGELRPILASLKSKGLVIPLTPEGRGHVVTHGLYPPDELETVKAQYGIARPVATTPQHAAPSPAVVTRPASPTAAPMAAPTQPHAPSAVAAIGVEPEVVERLSRELAELRSQVAQLRSDLEDLTAVVERTEEEILRLRDEVNG